MLFHRINDRTYNVLPAGHYVFPESRISDGKISIMWYTRMTHVYIIEHKFPLEYNAKKNSNMFTRIDWIDWVFNTPGKDPLLQIVILKIHENPQFCLVFVRVYWRIPLITILKSMRSICVTFYSRISRPVQKYSQKIPDRTQAHSSSTFDT